MERGVVVAFRLGVDVAAFSDEEQDTVYVSSIRRPVEGQGTRLIDRLVDVGTVPDEPIAYGQVPLARRPVECRGSVWRATVVDVTSACELTSYSVQVTALDKFDQFYGHRI